MGITALSGPQLNYGVTVSNSTDGITGISADYNDQRAPDASDLGYSMMDPRAAYNYSPGSGVTAPTYAFYGSRGYVDYVPTAPSTIAIVANTASSGTSALTLQAASSARGTYATDLIAPESGATLTSVLTFDSSVNTLMYNSFGQSGTIRTWAPGWGAGRCVQVVTSSYTDTPVTVTGRDIYGYKVSETITVSSTSSITSSYGGIGRKAFKFITAVTNSSVPSSTGISVGTTDRFGVPMYTPYVGGDITVRVSSTTGTQNAAVALTSANFTLAQGSTVTATSTTPDVRGVFISSIASDGTLRLQISVTPAASGVVSVTPADLSPIFGATQYSA